MNEIKLKPCPFCGSPAQIKELSGRYAVVCTRYCAGTRVFLTKDKPAEEWNRRVDNG